MGGADRAGTVSGSSLHAEKHRKRLGQLGSVRTRLCDQRNRLGVVLARCVSNQGDATGDI
jgi:hypothetical protein